MSRPTPHASRAGGPVIRRLLSRALRHVPDPIRDEPTIEADAMVVPALEPDPIDLELAAILATTPRGRRALPWTERTRGIDESAAVLEEAGVMAPPRGAHKAVQP